MASINCKGNLIDLITPRVMGILNLTPDSFYEGSRFTNADAVLAQAEKMLDEGADFIDVGAYSSRPGATDISVDEELSRLLPVVEVLVENFPEVLLSVDTFRAKVAEEAIGAGAAMINDISAGLLDNQMLPTVAALQVPYVMMHMKGSPQTMKNLAQYNDLVKEVIYYLSERIAAARALGINDLIIDPGFGFAKTIAHNFELLDNAERLQMLDVPVLIGVSRKSMIYKTLNVPAAEALNGTTVLNTIALQKGASILRVHDVKPAVEAVRLVQALSQSEKGTAAI
ncbi:MULTISPECIES: dihydropteroate synthase [unclassified Leeuwenhoekiella]|uniref:dihydropteroate synthase n=1 Tax=unclassified Leeuwenhoekiella TaxID=2615029 RepID=UPI000C678D87|nr:MULTISPECIES: dihydropteroate synthase [unclassified Leeuwenhoekiella]MAW93666.1 dihydropteroate synthase [Leeuwenhoekiella sp.]MBA80409.1 dihydropteroate synthase [Leeuwenhoekiella sp.]|tara:strand:+ start:6821 stop:7672 length:852 start_codon:yes stop_codon:yes gene_type:complete